MMKIEPRFHGLTVEEHLTYINGLYSTFEQQYIMVQRLSEKVSQTQEDLIADAKRELSGMLHAYKFDSQKFIDENWEQSRFRMVSREIENLVKGLKELFDRNQFDCTTLPDASWFDELVKKVNTYRCVDESARQEHSVASTPKERYDTQPKLHLFDKDQYSTELDMLRKFLQSIDEHKPFAPLLEIFFSRIEDIYTSVIEEPSERKKIVNAANIFIVLLANEKNPQVKIQKFKKSMKEKFMFIEEYGSFFDQLHRKTGDLKSLASIYVDNVLDSMKINWTGTISDCKALFDFLKENNYINAKYINKFIAEHFLFNGKTTTPEAIRKLHPNDHGKIREIGDYLKIPSK